MEDKNSPSKDEFCVCWAKSGRVMTPREEEILQEIRKVRNQYDELKKSLLSESDDSRRSELESKLQALRIHREELERLRIEASKERMRLLGHEK